MPAVREWVIATRPWSFPASIIAVLIGASLAYTSRIRFSLADFLVTLVGAIAIHTAGNLTNTYYDYKHGLDQKATADDRTLFDTHLKPHHVKRFFEFCFLLSTLVGLYFVLFRLPDWDASLQLLMRGILGTLLAFFYTAAPLKLKYHALGDIVIIICFGPLLVEATFFIQTRTQVLSVLWFSLPIALLTEGILHVNNTRDIESDRKANAVTIAQILGRKGSFIVYLLLFVGAYASLLLLSYWYSFIMMLPLLSLPVAKQLIVDFQHSQWNDLCPRTGQLGLLFGLLFCASIIFGNIHLQ